MFWWKRSFDVLVSTFILLILSPVLLAVAVMIRIKLGSPVIFVHQRPGLNDQPFPMLKFRTMANTVDENGALLPDEERMTGLGKFLRKTSLDELPELINVLRGEMSLVGPRPLLMKYLPLYSDEQRRRHHVRPGITGLAQVNGRNDLSWQEKFEYDVRYVETCSPVLDFKILLKTIATVFGATGVNQGDLAAGAEHFKGNHT